jgi:DNA mismatch repair protein MutL
MPRIQALSPSVINKIAAGEVIERPASAVKELLENSVDALATHIEVDIAAGGLELIRIVDDGEGIHPDDLPLAIASHATSKITSADDLFDVRTFGFRGEALASIAEVSRFKLRSRQPSAAAGAELEVIHGAASPVRTCGCPVGTCLEIRQLFENVPVRRKFLKSVATEFGQITEQFTRVAVAHPRLHLVLRHNDRNVYQLPPVETPLDRLRTFFGDDLVDQLIPIDTQQAGVRLWGYVAHPSVSKSTRKQQYFFLNGRWFQDRSLQHALTEAYRGLLMVGRQPVAFLFFELGTDRVDVNVHPTKSEVRFQDTQQLFRLLLSTLRSKFLSLDLQSTLTLPGGSALTDPLAPLAPRPAAPTLALQTEFTRWAEERLSQWSPEADPVLQAVADQGLEAEDVAAAWSPATTATAVLDAPASLPTTSFPESPRPAVAATAGLTGVRAMQIHDCYIVVETDEGLTVIDQHALHERILYEQFRARVLANVVEAQRLLMPVPVEVPAKHAALLIEQAPLLERLGVGLEEFGKDTVLLTKHPVLLRRYDLTQLVHDLAEGLDGGGNGPSRRDLLDELLHMMSCKAAVKAGQRLSTEEIEALLVQRHLVDDAHHCPHGRPTALKLSRAELDRQFGRLG